ncbi:MAG: TM0106 family RecB-like putative nuclease [Gemmatimonadota bacterium]
MQRIDNRLVFSATDLSNFLACQHLTLMDRRTASGGPRPPKYDDPALELLWKRGLEHEQAWLTAQRAGGDKRIVEIAEPSKELQPSDRWPLYAARTIGAMRAGADLIYQGALFDGTWLGRADFLQRVDLPSQLGDWSYEVVDTKLAREAKGGALLQVLLYSDLLAKVQGMEPTEVHLALGGPDARTHTFRVADYAAYFRSIRQRFLKQVTDAPDLLPRGAEPMPHCDICAWKGTCADERRELDHLALVAGISRSQRRALAGRGVVTMEGLAALTLPLAERMETVNATTLVRIHGQARIQVQGRRENRPLHELLLPVAEEQGLARLPPLSPGDLFFDLESDPYALTLGIEYLFGFADVTGDYTGWWALDRAAERRVFERFIDFIMTRLQQYPDLHIYHYAPYETTALKRLMGRFGSRAEEVDRLLRGKVLVDLYRVVKQALRASVESYSIKKMEPFYQFERAVDLREASTALAHFGAWLELGVEGGGGGTDQLRTDIEGYNRDDVLSTLRLRDWLESLRSEVEQSGTTVPRPGPESSEPSEPLKEKQIAINALVDRLASDVPADEPSRTPEQHARWLMAQLLEFHRREDKSMWWEYFRCIELSPDELIEDGATLGGLEYVGVVDAVKRSQIHRYRFPKQEHDLTDSDEAVDAETQNSAGEIWAVDDAACTIDLKRGTGSKVPHPRSLVPFKDVREDALRDSILRVGAAVAEHGLTVANPYRSAVDLLMRNPPGCGQALGAALALDGESPIAAGIRLLQTIDGSVLPIQGPPGAGKTYTAARMVLAALADGKRVGVTSNSHKVIANLLDEIGSAAAEAGVAINGIQKCSEQQKCVSPQIAIAKNNDAVLEALQTGEARLAAGTAWLWSDAKLTSSVDVLFIDEAGQFSLANTVAVAPSAASMVLLGDPQQLDQPMQGVHPPGVNVSALDHLLGESTVPPDRGLFLDQTWRLHPSICAFTSEIFYSGRLQSRAGLERQNVQGPAPLSGNGLRFIPVAHQGNENDSPEEVEAIARLVDLAVAHCSWTDAKGETHKIGLRHILIVAPYNAQVSAIADRLPAGARVGTVDKFQGQEAPIVIYSMATSSAEEAPRGMQFLYSPNRLNVATSRARCLAIVIASPQLFLPDCRTPEQMRLANAFCRFQELAQ